jgi:uncharacterized protein involved in exopolysaccharide biosynthesis
VQEVEKQIAETKAALDVENGRPTQEQTTDQNPTYATVQTELAKAQAELSGLKARAGAAEAIAADYRQTARRLQESEIAQDDLQRAAKTQEENYQLYVRKREEARISEALDERGILNVAVAEQPILPSLPIRSPLTAGGLGILLACCLSISTAFVMDFADPSFRTPDEIARYLGTPVLAALPKGQ